MQIPSDFINDLRKRIKGSIRIDKVSRLLYSTDASIYSIEPLGVVIPENQEDLIATVEMAAKYKIPILPRGSGSSLAGQAIGPALILDCSKFLDRIIKIDPESRTAEVEPGVILANLNREASRFGLMFGPDPASAQRATMGGVIGNNATGAHSILYGMTADHLLEAQVLMSNGQQARWGWVERRPSDLSTAHDQLINTAFDIKENYLEEIYKNWPRTWRNSAGYRLNYLIPWSATNPPFWGDQEYPPRKSPIGFNLATLLAGSEGTLAVIQSATIKLVPRPACTLLGLIQYESIAAACDSIPRLLQLQPSAIELIPRMLLQLARESAAFSNSLGFIKGDPAALIVVEFSGNDPETLKRKALSLGSDILLAESAGDQAKVWAVRKAGLGIIDSRPQENRPIAFIEDCALPVEELGNFVREVERILQVHGTSAAFYAHASAGCLHIRPLVNLKTSKGLENLREISNEVAEFVLSRGGAMSSEHGDGILRAGFLPETYGNVIIEGIKKIKKAADPDSLLNPQKFYDSPPIDSNLRYGLDYKANPWNTELDFKRNGSLTLAIEQCNGQGVCRKFDGVMCPSFQATREEIYSTRGRANLLRAMISAKSAGIDEEDVRVALDLCLACKGCKAECPSSVDMAKLKYEFFSKYYQNHSRRLRDYLFGFINELVQPVHGFAPVINWVAGKKIGRKIIQSTLGISEKRQLPNFGSVRKHLNQISGKDNIEECLFLPDTFTHFFEPEIEQAAFSVLDACHIKTKILPVFGAGRTLVSKGFIKEARNHLINLLRLIKEQDPEGILPIIGLEPSEIYLLRDELLDLLPVQPEENEKILNRAWMIDEYLIRPGGKSLGNRLSQVLKNELKHDQGKILLHGHCYQKAQQQNLDGYPTGVSASEEILKQVGYEVEVMDTGCCGMAGAFGYESEHYEVSMQIGEIKLFPEIRKAKDQFFGIAAPGTSCRSQITDGTGVKAKHSIVLVADRLSRS